MFRCAGSSVGRLYACLCASLSLFSLASAIYGQTTYDWNPLIPSGSQFGEAFNWSPAGGPPSAGDTARINFGPPTTVLFSYSPTNAALQYQSGETAFQPSGTDATYTLTSASEITGGHLVVLPDGDSRLKLDFTSLSLSGDSGLSIFAGTVRNSAALTVGNGSSGFVDFSGPNTLYENTSSQQSTLGFGNGGIGAMTFSGEAIGSFAGPIRVGGGSSTGGLLEVNLRSMVSLGDVSIGNGDVVGQFGRIRVFGAGSQITQGGNSTLTLGAAVNTIASIEVFESGVYNTGAGLTTVNATGSIEIGIGDFSDGTFNANGDVDVNGGSIIRNNGSFNLAAGRTLTATSGGQIDLGGATELSGGTTWMINSEADLFSSGSMDIGASGGTTKVTIDGAGSSLSAAGNSNWGRGGHAAEVTLRSGASANVVGAITLGHTAMGSIAVESGATMTMGNLIVAPSGGTANGAVTVTGLGSTLMQTAGGALAVGQIAGTATIDVLAGGVFSTGTFGTTVGRSGSIHIDDGTFNANGDVDVNGGSITRTAGGFNLAAGRTLTASDDAQIDLGGGTALSGGTTWNITDGADLFNAADMNIGTSGGITTVIIDGAGSSLTTGSDVSRWGVFGNAAQVTIRNSASANVGTIVLADSSVAGTTGSLTVESGATMTTRNLAVIANGGAMITGTITVTGAGSTLTQTGSSTLFLGHPTAGTATLNVLDGGTFTAGSRGTILRATATINIDGGTANLGPLDVQGGTINFVAGSLSFVGDLTVGAGGLLGENITLDAVRALRLSGTTTIDPSRVLALDGGSLTTNGLIANGPFQFHSGTLELTGGTITGLSSLAVPTNGEFRARGVQAMRITGAAGSTITATDDLTLGVASLANGFYTNGTVNVGASTLTILDANDAVFDSGALLSMGSGGTSGTANAANGLTLDFGGNIAGHGTVDTPDDPFRPLTNNGHITGNSAAEPITLTGYVKGVGRLDNVVITGTDAPGFSPAIVHRGSVEYAGTLEIELADTATGEFDAIHHSGTAALGGALDVSLLGGFVPEAGSSFEILTADGGVSGVFATESLPDLGSLLALQVIYDASSVTLAVVAALAGDFNTDGVVNAADYVVWRKSDGSQDAYDTWRENFGNTSAAGAAAAQSGVTRAAVPEPVAFVLLGLGGAGLALIVRRRT